MNKFGTFIRKTHYIIHITAEYGTIRLIFYFSFTTQVSG